MSLHRNFIPVKYKTEAHKVETRDTRVFILHILLICSLQIIFLSYLELFSLNYSEEFF